VLNRMRRTGLRQCTPRNRDPAMGRRPWIDFTSGYVQRAIHLLPQQGARAPWRAHQNYLKDLYALKLAPLNDGALEFSNPAP